MDEKRSQLEERLSKMGTKKKMHRMPDGSMMSDDEMNEKYGETTPMINMPKKDRFKKMSITGKRG